MGRSETLDTAQEVEDTWYERMCILSPSELLRGWIVISLIIWLPVLLGPPVLIGVAALTCFVMYLCTMVAYQTWRAWIDNGAPATRRRTVVAIIVGFFGLEYLCLSIFSSAMALIMASLHQPLVYRFVSAFAALGHVVVIAFMVFRVRALNRSKIFYDFLPEKEASRARAQYYGVFKYLLPLCIATIPVWFIAMLTHSVALYIVLGTLGGGIGVFSALFCLFLSIGWLYQCGVLVRAGVLERRGAGNPQDWAQ